MDTFGPNFILLTIVLTTLASVIYFIVITRVITQMDKQYFVRKSLAAKNMTTENILPQKTSGDSDSQGSSLRSKNSSIRYILHIAKIIVGLCLLLFGLAMLVLPSQGLTTMLIGLSLLPFSGKNKLEQNLFSRKSVKSTLNWIRMKANKEPFVFD
jgi:hypothetical protein